MFQMLLLSKPMLFGCPLLKWLSAARMQCGRADGYILEGRELEFYVKKMQKKKVGGDARGALVSSYGAARVT